MTRADDIPVAETHTSMPTWLVLLIATACGVVVANLYYSQPLVGEISGSLGLPAQSAGLIVTLTQIGYGAGLLLVVPLGDLYENRTLVSILLAAETVVLAAAALVRAPIPFLAISALIGLAAVAVQILVPFTSHYVPEHQRGRIVGTVMSGLTVGIMLARPVASLIASVWSWRAVYAVSAVLVVAIAVAIRFTMPARRPAHTASYPALLASLPRLMRNTPVLRRRALYHACLFGSFSLFWTAVPLLLTSDAFGLSQSGVALFALAGVAGAAASPIAGRMADRGRTRTWTRIAIVCVLIALATAAIAPTGSAVGLAILVGAAILLDFGVMTNVVLGQRAIFNLGSQLRARLNGLYMATFFAGGGLGSALGGYVYAHHGWTVAALTGAILPALALGYFLTDRHH
ncbi:MFS transporter [Rhodococcus opacus]|uniref:MFS transporter n=1 Tax=Rhodococcus opacus TaxID=37919 RepID=UPI001C45BBD5|nr:MFS transporter [Rhodococcus opacus]MBV6759883.1 MFS transporter [Rhodococcus opacus]